jgi:hypothetical protein
LRDLSASAAYRILREHPEKWADEDVRAQFLKDWVNAPAAEAARAR